MLSCKSTVLLCLMLMVSVFKTVAQLCPANIGFEDGNFTNWECSTGVVDGDGVVKILQSTGDQPTPNRHTIMKNTSPQQKDAYGGFPVNCPNGSGYSIQIGNSNMGGEAESVNYTISIPANQNDFTLTYYYAVVLENPKHEPQEQPKFVSQIEDLTPGKLPGQYQSSLACANHTFIASSGLPGFVSITAGIHEIQYKDWSPVSLHLQGYAGHKIKLTFATNDCTRGAHFGYAYLDFDQNCASSIVTGGPVCTGAQSATLTAVSGYETYSWFKVPDLTQKLSSAHSYKISSLPADGTQFALIAKPYGDNICLDTIYTTINRVNAPFELSVVNSIAGCSTTGGEVDLTAPAITAGSSPNLKLEYFKDIEAQNFISDPKLVVESGTYYIRGSNTYGCTDIKAVKVIIYNESAITVNQPAPVCKPNVVDITSPNLVKSNEPTATYAYYADQQLTMPVANPQRVAQSGTYYVKISGMCVSVKSLNVVVADIPVVNDVPAFAACAPFSLNDAIPNPSTEITCRFFTDAAVTQPVIDPLRVTTGGAYYYKAINAPGCESNVASINIVLSSPPVIQVVDPDEVVYPATVDLSGTYQSLPNTSYTYWKNADATIPVDNYQAVIDADTYYIKAVYTNAESCFTIAPVHVKVSPPPLVDIVAPNTFSPNGDGINDAFSLKANGAFNFTNAKIFNRYGQVVFEARQQDFRWDGAANNGKPIPAGTYYWVFSCYDTYRNVAVTKSGAITVIR